MGINSIRSWLIGIVFVCIIATSAIMGVIGYSLTTSFISRRYHRNFEILSGYMAKNAELGVLLNDQGMLGGLARNMLEQEEIQGVSILSIDGEVLTSIEKKPPGKNLVQVEARVLTPEMAEGNLIFQETAALEEIGRVVLAYSLRGVEQLKKEMAVRFSIASVLLSAFVVVCYWFLSRSITAPIKDLHDVSRKVSMGRLDVRAKGGNFPETRALAHAFNRMLADLKDQQDELEDAYTEMAASEALAEVGKFSMLVAHEIKNPLAIIKGSLDLLKKEGLDPSARESMHLFLDEETARINRLVEDFLVFSKPRRPEFTELEMNGFVRSMGEKMRLLSAEKELEDVELLVETDAVLLRCDPSLMERAMMNIFGNALDMSEAGTGVTVATEKTGHLWSFIVKDRGPGIGEGDLSKIFDPFFTTKAKGTGLGLALAGEIVKAHGGRITARNRKDGGAVFEISLPLSG